MMNCEYLVYTNDGSKLSPEELSSAFEILTTIPYPYNTNPYNAAVLSNLTLSNRNLLDINETAVVLELLQHINPQINILPLPKSMVQFYLYAGIKEIRISDQHELFIQELKVMELEIRAAYEKKFRDDGVKSYGEINSQVEDDIPERMSYFYPWRMFPQIGSIVAVLFDDVLKDCIRANSHVRVKELWMSLNNALLREFFCDEKYSFSQSLLLKKINLWTAEFFKIYTKNVIVELDPKGVPYHDFLEYAENIDTLRKFLTLEVNIIFDDRINHLYTAYRGSRGGPYGDINLIKREPAHTLSLNNGICEGAANDIGANAWYYSSEHPDEHPYNPRSGFVIMFDPSLDKDTFMIPPSNIVSRTLGYGEDFHVRTKFANNQRNKELLVSNTFLVNNQLYGEDKAYEALLKHRTGTLTAYLNSKVDNTVCAPWPEHMALAKEQTSKTGDTLVNALPYAFLALFCLYVGKKVYSGCGKDMHNGSSKERQPLIKPKVFEMV